MPHRRLVQIASQKPAPPPEPLPTVADYFRDLAMRQGEDIRLLKERAQTLADLRASRKSGATRRKSVREESWRLHPVVEVPDSKKPPSRLDKNRKKVGHGKTRKPKTGRTKRH